MSDPKYFQTTKRGELHELKEELHHANQDKKKAAVKKVIAAMTVGKDVSSLFPDVVNCMQTNNIELKKLVYLYVINYAKAQPELAILAVNTFRKDSLDPNPLIRALAVRTMGCIRLEQISEYLVEPLKRCCKDPDSYVRKTAAICVSKLHDINPSMVHDQGFIGILQEMVSDACPIVVANAVVALAEISALSGKDSTNQHLNLNEVSVQKLLTAFNDCTEWGQIFILDALVHYFPKNAVEADSILDKVLPRLSHANPAVVLSCTKVVLKLLERLNNQTRIDSIEKKLSAPLVTLLSFEPEIQYVVLRNISLILQKRPNIFSSDIKVFFCKYNDPVYVKIEKLDIIVRLLNTNNYEQIISELKDYTTEIDVEFVRRAIRCMGRCAVKLSRVAEKCVPLLMEVLDSRVSYAVQETVSVLKDIFRRYPKKYESVVVKVCEEIDSIDEPEAKASIVWIIGEYAERLGSKSVKFLESFVETFDDEPVTVQLQILTASVKLFLKRPNEAQRLVTQVLNICTEESDNPDLRDRAFIYWRLLSSDPEATKQVVLGSKPPISDDSNQMDLSTLNVLLENISMLASVYHRVPSSFSTRLRAVEAESETDTVDENSSIQVIQQRMSKQSLKETESVYKEDSDDGSSFSNADEESSEENEDLVDLSSPPITRKISERLQQEKINIVLSPEQSGSRGQKGLGVAAGCYLDSSDRNPVMHLIFKNKTESVLKGWAIQINKNFFGFAATSPLNCSPLNPQSNEEAIVQLDSKGTFTDIPLSPLVLQVAIKTNIDIFYFVVPYEIDIAFIKGAQISKKDFLEKWQSLQDIPSNTILCLTTSTIAMNHLNKDLGEINVQRVADRTSETFEAVYFFAKTVSKNSVLAEICLQIKGSGVKVNVRCDLPQLVPLFQNLIVKKFSLKMKS